MVYGPITNPQIACTYGNGGGASIYTVAGFTIAAGHFLQIDTKRKSALYDGDPYQPQSSAIDWQRSLFPVFPAGGVRSWFNLYGQTTTGVTQCVATWQDGYIT